MPYEGGTKVWSNRYFFTGDDPSNSASWLALFNARKTDESILIPPSVSINGWVGYNAGSDVPVASGSASIAGLSVPGSAHSAAPGDCAAVTRFSTDQRSLKNHPIYLYKFVHGVWIDEAVSNDKLHGDQKNSIETSYQAWITGYTVDGTVRHLCGPRGAVALTRLVNTYIRHRDFPR